MRTNPQSRLEDFREVKGLQNYPLSDDDLIFYRIQGDFRVFSQARGQQPAWTRRDVEADSAKRLEVRLHDLVEDVLGGTPGFVTREWQGQAWLSAGGIDLKR